MIRCPKRVAEAAVPAAAAKMPAGYLQKEGASIMVPERIGYIVWVNDLKAARNLEKYGTLHYVSRRMHYAVVYLNADRAEETAKHMRRLSYVRKIERSHRTDLKTDYGSKLPEDAPLELPDSEALSG